MLTSVNNAYLITFVTLYERWFCYQFFFLKIDVHLLNFEILLLDYQRVMPFIY